MKQLFVLALIVVGSLMGIDRVTSTQDTLPFSSIQTSRMITPRVSLIPGNGQDGSTRVFTTAGFIAVHTLVVCLDVHSGCPGGEDCCAAIKTMIVDAMIRGMPGFDTETSAKSALRATVGNLRLACQP